TRPRPHDHGGRETEPARAGQGSELWAYRRTSARMADRTAWGSAGQAPMTAAKSGSRATDSVETAPDSAAPFGADAVFPGESGGRSNPVGVIQQPFFLHPAKDRAPHGATANLLAPGSGGGRCQA